MKEFTKDLEEISRRQEYRTTAQIRQTVKIDTDRPFALIATGDWHIANEGFDGRQWEEDMDLITKCDNCGMILMGDEIDNFNFLPALHEQIMTPGEQLKILNKFTRKYKNKILGRVGGNHTDEWMLMNSGIEFSELIEEVPYLREGGLFRLKIGDVWYRILAYHAVKGTSTDDMQKGNRIKERIMGPADITMSGHTHQIGFSEEHVFRNNKYVTKIFAKTGSYKKYDRFAAQRGFEPTTTGSVVFVLDPKEKKIHTVVGVKEGLELRDLLDERERTK